MPKKLDSIWIDIDELSDKVNLKKYLIKFVADTGCELVSWGEPRSSLCGKFAAEFKDANPYALVGAISAAIKENSTALGKTAALLDIKAIEQVPEIAEYINHYLQRKV